MSLNTVKSGSHQPIILSMEVDDDNEYESEYRIQLGREIRYLVIAPGTLDRDDLSFPIESISRLPWEEQWTVAHMMKGPSTGNVKISVKQQELPGVKDRWHAIQIDCLDLTKTTQLTAAAFEATMSPELQKLSLPSTGIAKIARFQWEIPRIEAETKAYKVLEGSGIAPRFLGHIQEGGRTIGFLLEKVDGRSASIQDLDLCKTALTRFHEMGYKHGDVNRYNFLVTQSGVKLIDFERFQKVQDSAALEEELSTLEKELIDESGRGGGFIFHDDD